ncbi:MAG: hypothetical protein MUO67_06370 [Anaerolineales bacterium]|nr:hypothetical protein [Anaerolineales bacterium]
MPEQTSILTIIQSRRPQIKILISFILVYLIILLITSLAASLKVIEFTFLTISFGFAPAYYFRNVFNFKNIIGWVIHAGVFGLLFIPFLFLFLGWLKINIVFEYSVIFLYLCSLIGISSLFFLAEEDNIKSTLNFDEIHKIDSLILFLFLGFTAFLTLINFSNIYIHWDTFTFWGLDAKYIFEQNQLRDIAFNTDVIIHRYTSFHPLYYSIIYDLYGGIYEQYAAWINIYINLLAMLLIYRYVLNKGVIHKFIVSASTLIVSYSAITIMKMFSMYADIVSAFLLLVFYLILVDDAKKTIDTYWRRITLLLLIAISFYLIKSHYFYFTVLLIGVLSLYDWKFLSENFRILVRRKSFWLSILGISILWIMRFVYFSNIGGASISEEIDSSFLFSIQSASINSLIEYLVDLLEYMIRGTPYFLGLWWLTLCSILFVKEINKKYMFIFSSAILIFLIPVASYLMRQPDLQSGSLSRYSAMAMYLFPLAISYVHIESNRFKKITSIIIFSIVLFYVSLNILWPMPLKEKFSISNGTLRSAMTKYDQYAELVVNLTGQDARILIVDDLSGEMITNMNVPAIFIRYFMMYNSVGSQYQKQTNNFYDYAKENYADYALLLSYDTSLDHCEELLTVGKDYLINIRAESINSDPDECIFSSFDIYDLGEAVR